MGDEQHEAPFSLRYVEWQVSYELLSDLHLQGFPGSAVRGTFGHALKDVGCQRRTGTCEGCFAPHRCLYAEAFEGSRHRGRRDAQNVPPPFVIDVENFPMKARSGERAVVLFRFFGDLVDRAPELLDTLRQLGERGLGNEYRVSMKLREAWSTNGPGRHVIWSSDGGTGAGGELHRTVHRNLGHLTHSSSTLRTPFELWLKTPTRIKSPGGRLEPPTGERLLRAVIARVHSMAELYGETPLTREDCELLLREWAGSVDIAGPTNVYYPSGLERISQRKGRRHALDGYLAQWRITRAPASLMPWLFAAERLSIGGSAAFGYGGVRLVQGR